MANIAKRADGRRWRARYRDPADQERARHFSPQGRRPAVARGRHHLHGDRHLRRPEDGPDHRGGVDRHLAAGIRHAVRLDGAAGARARGTDRGRVRSHAAGRRAPVAGEGVDGRAEGRGSGTVVRLRAALAAVADPRRRRSRRVDRPHPVLTADVARRRPAARLHRLDGPGVVPARHRATTSGAGDPALALKLSAAHPLRHCFASLLIASGADVKIVQARLRHASAKTTLDTYGHLWPDGDQRRGPESAESSPLVRTFCGLQRPLKPDRAGQGLMIFIYRSRGRTHRGAAAAAWRLPRARACRRSTSRSNRG